MPPNSRPHSNSIILFPTFQRIQAETRPHHDQHSQRLSKPKPRRPRQSEQPQQLAGHIPSDAQVNPEKTRPLESGQGEAGESAAERSAAGSEWEKCGGSREQGGAGL